jgi:hypothetical protein
MDMVHSKHDFVLMIILPASFIDRHTFFRWLLYFVGIGLESQDGRVPE